jgi:hypothetical protein
LNKAREAFHCIARIVLAAWLALALLSGLAPFGALSSETPLCQMECCVGLPAHVAGSCADVSCRAPGFVEAERPSTPEPQTQAHCRTQETVPVLHHQAVHEALDQSAPPGASHRAAADETAPPPEAASTETTARIASSAWTRPCREDCGQGANSTGNSHAQQRQAALLARAYRRPPLRLADISSFSAGVSRTLQGLRRRSRPRAPPLS